MSNNDALNNAIIRKQVLGRELQEIDSFLKLFQKFSGIDPSVTPILIKEPPRRGRPNRSDVLGNYIVTILADGKSLHTKDILDCIMTNNREDLINSNDRLHSISVVLSRDPRFISNREYGWSLKQELPDLTE